MDSAEKLTKFLRSKDHPSDKVVDLADQLLDDALDVYLPNKDIFVFELLCDRVGDNGKLFKDWKSDPKVWDLWTKCWSTLQTKGPQAKIARGRLMRKVRIIDILITVLVARPCNALAESIFSFLTSVCGDLFIEVDESTSMKLIAAYMTAIDILAPNVEWVKQLEQLSLQHTNVSSYKPTKKLSLKFAAECLPSILRYITLHSDTKEYDMVLERIVIRLLFNKISRTHLKDSVEAMLDSAKDSLTSQAIKYFFELLIQKTNFKDLETPAVVIIAIREKSKVKDITETLLSVLSKNRRTLPTSLVTDLYAKEKGKDSKSINWDFMEYLLSLDTEVASNVSEELFDLMSQKDRSNEQKFLQIAKSLLESITRARELSSFITELWPKLVSMCDTWKSDAFISLVSTQVKELSPTQIYQVSKSLLDNKQSDVILCALVRGLVNVTNAKRKAVQDLLLEYFNTLQNSGHLWEIRYYLLCIYGDDIEFASSVSSDLFEKANASRFYLFAVFRYTELTMGQISGERQLQLIECLKNELSALRIVYDRWLVIIEKFFSPDMIEKILLLYIEDDNLNLPRYLHEDGLIFFEQVNLTKALTKLLVSKTENGDLDDTTCNIIKAIPIQCYDKISKRVLVNSLVERSLLTTNIEFNNNMRLAISHLLSSPSYASSLELQFKKVSDFLNSSTQADRQTSLYIVHRIWTNHCNQIKVTESKKFINMVLKTLTKFFLNYQFKSDLPPEFEMAHIVLDSKIKMSDPDFAYKFEQLEAAFVSWCLSVVSSHIDSKIELGYIELNRILEVLYESINDVQRKQDIAKLVKQLGKQSSSQLEEDRDLKINLFKLLTKTANPSSLKSGIHILSIFIALCLHFEVDLKCYLMDYLFQVSGDMDIFSNLCGFLITSMNDFQKTESKISIDILSCFVTCLQKEKMDSSINLFATIISSAIENINILNGKSILNLIQLIRHCLSNKAWLFNQYCLESSMTLLTIVSRHLSTNTLDTILAAEIYISSTQALSHILLFHRFRLSSRHHLIMTSFTALLEALTLKNPQTILSSSSVSAAAYSRVVGNLCEPMKAKVDESSNGLNSISSLIKRSLRKHLPVLLLNYIYLSLKFNFHHDVNVELSDGIFKIYDVLSSQELEVLNSALDAPGRALFKTSYSNYKDHGKWKDL